ncbi:MAG: deoxyhypusine synthase family protein [Candidatus Rokubacteria bacterium]|nr:deoxyhypusine synthase family protein [Candidatus Rokubacteria bacterium]
MRRPGPRRAALELRERGDRHVDDAELWGRGFYRFYDHVVAAAEYDRMEDFTAEFFEHLAAAWPRPAIPGVRFMHELGRWLDARGLGGSIAATCARHRVPLFVPAAPDGTLSEGYRTARRKGPVVDFFKDYEIAIGLSGAGVATECISWGKESPDGMNVMVFTDFTIALPLLCQGLLERYGPAHVRPARAAIRAELTAVFET